MLLLALLVACAVEEAPVVEVPAPPPKPAKARPRATAPPVPGLVMPSPAECLDPPAGEALGDEGMAASRGLDPGAVREVMRGFLGNTLACVPSGTAPNGTVTTEITVACTGVVARVRVVDGGGLPEGVVECVRQTLGYAGFPAHDLPDGFTFVQPVTFSF